MNLSLILVAILLFAGCDSVTRDPVSVTWVTSVDQQNSTFNRLLSISGNILREDQSNDSLAFLILPVEASCPACRKKTIDSIISHQNNLPANHYIIISANGGRKTMSAYFREQNTEMPELPDQLILDSTNAAYKYELFKDNPAIYYSINRKVYKKVLAIPATVKQDLREFFSGNRNDDYLKQ